MKKHVLLKSLTPNMLLKFWTLFLPGQSLIPHKEGILSTLKEGSGRRAEVLMFNKLINIVA